MGESEKGRESEGERQQSKPGQTGPRLTEVASGPQTINKERSNLWTGSLISTLLLFSHLIDGLQCRFVLPPLLLVQQLLFFPAFLLSFLSFSREINTHSWTGRATDKSRRLGDELREGRYTFGWAKNCETRNIIMRRTIFSYLSIFYIDNNFDFLLIRSILYPDLVHARRSSCTYTYITQCGIKATRIASIAYEYGKAQYYFANESNRYVK